MSRGMVLTHDRTVKPCPSALSDQDVFLLMRAFTTGKCEVLEDDALVLVRWAQRVRTEGMLLRMMLNQEIVPSVQDGAVHVALPPALAGRN